jgi:hypothetical protein
MNIRDAINTYRELSETVELQQKNIGRMRADLLSAQDLARDSECALAEAIGDGCGVRVGDLVYHSYAGSILIITLRAEDDSQEEGK